MNTRIQSWFGLVLFIFSMFVLGFCQRTSYALSKESKKGHLYKTVHPLIGSEQDGGPALVFRESNTTASGNFRFGYDVAMIGDVNEDGIEDFLVSMPFARQDRGQVLLFYGGKDSYQQPDLILELPDGTHFGIAVAGGGDVNGDGIGDFLVGSEHTQAFLYLGGSFLDAYPDFVFNSPVYGDYFARQLSFAGDVNADGYDDFIIAAPNGGTYGPSDVTLYLGHEDLDQMTHVILPEEKEGSHFGASLSACGDINQDGFDDFIIGARRYGINGRCYIYYGSNDPDAMADLVITGPQDYKDFGWTITGAGDINKDNFNDFIVRARNRDSHFSEFFVYFGGSNPDTVADLTLRHTTFEKYFVSMDLMGFANVNGDSVDDWIVSVFDERNDRVDLVAYFGGNAVDNRPDAFMASEIDDSGDVEQRQVLSGGGDINGDGIDDFLVGCSSHRWGEGGVALFYGGDISSGKTEDVWVAPESGKGNQYGSIVDNRGDVNGDGFMDLLVATPHYGARKGAVYIYFGGAQMDTTADVVLTGDAWGIEFGLAAAFAGDVNGDGYDDVIIGKKAFPETVPLYFGGPDMDAIPDVILVPDHGKRYPTEFGIAVSAAGDINNDGYGDVLVSEKSVDGNVYLYLGGPAMDGTPAKVFRENYSAREFGRIVTGLGDVNNDGYDDFGLAAKRLPDGSFKSGAIIYLGGTDPAVFDSVVIASFPEMHGLPDGMSSAGDMNGDGFDDILMTRYKKALLVLGSASFDGSQRVILPIKEQAEGEIVAGGGDINHDGYDDIIVGDDITHNWPGEAVIYCGGETIDGFADLVVRGENDWDYFGSALSCSGDMNGDGIADFVVGARFAGDNGLAYVVHGSLFPASHAPEFVSVQDQEAFEDHLFELNFEWTGYPEPTVELNNGPEGMIYDSGTAMLNWTPGFEQIGSNPIMLTAINELGADTLELEIMVNPVNDAPQLSDLIIPQTDSEYLIPAGHATAEVTFQWAKAWDEENDDVIYTLLLGQTLSFIADEAAQAFTVGSDTSHVLELTSGDWFWRVRAVDANGASVVTPDSTEPALAFTVRHPTGVEQRQRIPSEFSLAQNYPNPFNPETCIRFDLPVACQVRLDIMNSLGKTVATLVDRHKQAGSFTVSFNAAALPSGIYFYCLHAGAFTQVKKMIFLR
ncbi:T9SS type A sorting domain-containing protein [candidate division KSB1 bacterium]|nr:T9SS type A sorting domain-containing protein [candidate division KSB1 bacterium]